MTGEDPCHEPTKKSDLATQIQQSQFLNLRKTQKKKSQFRDPLKTPNNQLLNQLCLGNPPQPIRNSVADPLGIRSGSVRAHEDGGGAHEHRHGGH